MLLIHAGGILLVSSGQQLLLPAAIFLSLLLRPTLLQADNAAGPLKPPVPLYRQGSEKLHLEMGDLGGLPCCPVVELANCAWDYAKILSPT